MRPCALAAAVAQAMLAACGGGSRTPGAPPQATGDPPGAIILPPRAPPPPAPRALAIPPADCHVEADLPAPHEATPACGGAAVVLGSPREVVVPGDVAMTCSGATLGCDYACGQVAIDGAGAVAWWATGYLGGGGYTRPAFIRFAPGGGREPDGGSGPLIAPGAAGFLSYGWQPWLERYSEGQQVAQRDLPWPFAYGPWFGPSAYYGPLAFQADASGGISIAAMGLASDGSAELWAARVAAAGDPATPPFLVLSLPATSPGAWSDRDVVREAVEAVAIGRDGAGRFLVLWSGLSACGDGATAGRWFDGQGRPLGPVFRAGDPGVAGDLFLLPDGSLALQPGGWGPQGGGSWIRRFADGVPAGGAVPAWLAARAGQLLRFAGRSGRSVAIEDACARRDRRTRVDVLGKHGEVCASALLPRLDADDDACEYHAIAPAAVGYDGSLAQLRSRTCPAGDCYRYECRFDLWERAIR